MWGEEYLQGYLNACLPNQLSLGNLGALSDDPDIRYTIYTSPTDALVLKNHPMYERLRQSVTVEIITFDDMVASSDWRVAFPLMARAHDHAFAQAAGNDDGVIILPPDQVYSEGTLAQVVRLARAGKRVVMIPECRLKKESFIPALRRRFADEAGLIAPAQRELVALAMEHLHPVTESFFINSKRFNRAAYKIYWPIPGEGLLSRCLTIHPILIRPLVKGIRVGHSFDSDFLANSCPDFRDYHLVRDSDEMIGFEFSGLDPLFLKDRHMPEPGGNKFDIYNFTEMVKQQRGTIFEKLLRETVTIRSGDSSPRWVSAQKESDRLMRMVRALMAISGKAKKYRTLFNPYDKIYPDLTEENRVAIWGVGEGGKRTMDLARRFDWDVVSFIDSNEELWGQRFEGVEIRSPDDLSKEEMDWIIVASTVGRRPIMERLDQMGFAYKRNYFYFLDTVRHHDALISLAPWKDT